MRTDEWYNFITSPRGQARVLASLDETTYKGGTMGKDHPIAWCKQVGKGHVWYTGLGHTEASFTEPLFLKHLLGGIQAAAGVEGGRRRSRSRMGRRKKGARESALPAIEFVLA